MFDKHLKSSLACKSSESQSGIFSLLGILHFYFFKLLSVDFSGIKNLSCKVFSV
jgi:hypothetical protein